MSPILADLKAILAEKDRVISELQSQLRDAQRTLEEAGLVEVRIQSVTRWEIPREVLS